MIERYDESTGIVRHEYGTVSPKLCQKDIESLSCITRQEDAGNVKKYLAECGGAPIDISITDTRLIMYSPDRRALLDFEERLHLKEWEYENVTKLDYISK